MKSKTEETGIKHAIKDFLKYNGWYVWYNLNYGIGVFKGIPDISAIKDGVVLFIEVKSSKGVQSQYQIDFQKNITDQKGHYILARSVDDVNTYICENLWDTGVLF